MATPDETLEFRDLSCHEFHDVNVAVYPGSVCIVCDECSEILHEVARYDGLHESTPRTVLRLVNPVAEASERATVKGVERSGE